MITESGGQPDPAANAGQAEGAEPQRVDTVRYLGKYAGRGEYNAALHSPEFAERERAEALDKLAAALDTPEQGAALRSVAAGEGEPVALARVLQPVAHLLDPYAPKSWPLPSTPLVSTVWALAQLSHLILSDVESGGTTLDWAVFLAHYAHRVAFDGPERRAEFHRRAIAELKSLDAAHTEQCGKLYLYASRCQRCYERPTKQCELRIVEEVAVALLIEQKAEQRRDRAMFEWEKAVWPVWAVLCWIVFRLPGQICAVVDERGFNAERLYSDRWRAAEGALLSALQAGMLDAVRDRNPLLATHWWGPVRIEADTWFSRDRVIDLWPAPRLPLADYLPPDYDDDGRFAVHRQHEENQIGSQEDQRGDHEEESGDLVPGTQRLAERPLSKRGYQTVVTAAWDVIGLHDKWRTRGIPPEWSVQKATNEINKHLRSLIRHSRFNVPDYPLNTRNGRHEISADSVKRALETRRPRRT